MNEDRRKEHIAKLGIIAGGGRLPWEIRAVCVDQGRPYFLLAIDGEADPDLGADAVVPLGMIGQAVSRLKEAGCREVVMVGRVRRPDFRSIKFDWLAAKLLPQILTSARHGDDALLKVLGKTLEQAGMALIGVDDLTTSLLATDGAFGKYRPDAAHRADMLKGIGVVRALGPFDVGQAAVVCEGLVLAVEAAEGTDEMLARIARLPVALRGTPAARRGVLIKLPKPGQERRIDLPVIGAATVEAASQAGLSGIAVAAGQAIVLERDKLTALADRHGLFVYGFSTDEGP